MIINHKVQIHFPSLSWLATEPKKSFRSWYSSVLSEPVSSLVIIVLKYIRLPALIDQRTRKMRVNRKRTDIGGYNFGLSADQVPGIQSTIVDMSYSCFQGYISAKLTGEYFSPLNRTKWVDTGCQSQAKKKRQRQGPSQKQWNIGRVLRRSSLLENEHDELYFWSCH
jgi:hypothetical protein